MALNNFNNISLGVRKTRNNEVLKEKNNGKDVASKRSAENSPGKDSKKRSVLGDVTNNNNNCAKDTLKKGNLKGPIKPGNAGPSFAKQNAESFKKSETSLNLNIVPPVVPQPSTLKVANSESEVNAKEENANNKVLSDFEIKPIPAGVEDFDAEMANDPFSEALYAPDVFEYYKQREVQFTIEKYLDRQPDMTKSMRGILVDWMVEVQESFELNHETLYLAVKLIDMFLVKHTVPKTLIQLVGATAALIASKYDERLPPLVDDFLYICDDSYSRSELLAMECKILKAVGFDLGIPISYRFLRRYARCSKTPMDTLTLARFILETSLMDYDLIDERDSKLAAAALLLALKMKKESWTPTHEYYSGYKEEELLDLMKYLSKLISPPINRCAMTIRTKYSHPIFFEVAKIETLNLD